MKLTPQPYEVGDAKWKEFPDERLELKKVDGLRTIEAVVIQGGNTLWTAWYHDYTHNLGKNGRALRSYKLNQHAMMKPQSQTQSEAIAWCEETWQKYNNPTTP